MTYEEKKAWLERYGAAVRRERLLAKRIYEVRARAESVTQAMRPVVRGSGHSDKIAHAVEVLDGYQDELAGQVCAARSVYLEVRAAIDRLRDPLLRDVLELRYIDGLALWQAADRLRVSERHARRLHRQAVQELEVPPSAQTVSAHVRTDVVH